MISLTYFLHKEHSSYQILKLSSSYQNHYKSTALAYDALLNNLSNLSCININVQNMPPHWFNFCKAYSVEKVSGLNIWDKRLDTLCYCDYFICPYLIQYYKQIWTHSHLHMHKIIKKTKNMQSTFHANSQKRQFFNELNFGNQLLILNIFLNWSFIPFQITVQSLYLLIKICSFCQYIHMRNFNFSPSCIMILSTQLCYICLVLSSTYLIYFL